MSEANLLTWLSHLFTICYDFLTMPIITFTDTGRTISLWNLFSFVFVVWIGRNFLHVLLDRRNGEV